MENEETVAIFGKRINATLFDMIVGVLAFGLFCQMTVVWFLKDKLGYSLGLWLGILVAIAYIAHLWWSINRYVYLETGAPRLYRIHMIFRYFMVAAALALAGVTSFLNPLAVFLGVMGVKAAALLSLLVAKIRRR
jgi:hypothetical protein